MCSAAVLYLLWTSYRLRTLQCTYHRQERLCGLSLVNLRPPGLSTGAWRPGRRSILRTTYSFKGWCFLRWVWRLVQRHDRRCTSATCARGSGYACYYGWLASENARAAGLSNRCKLMKRGVKLQLRTGCFGFGVLNAVRTDGELSMIGGVVWCRLRRGLHVPRGMPRVVQHEAPGPARALGQLRVCKGSTCDTDRMT